MLVLGLREVGASFLSFSVEQVYCLLFCCRLCVSRFKDSPTTIACVLVLTVCSFGKTLQGASDGFYFSNSLLLRGFDIISAFQIQMISTP